MTPTPAPHLTDLRLRALLSARDVDRIVIDGTIPGMAVRISRRGLATWRLALRVKGEGGVNRHGRRLLGKKIALTLGHYPEMSIHAARAKAYEVLDGAKRGINPKHALAGGATAGGPTVEALSQAFMRQHIHSRELDSALNYQGSFDVHINPKVGQRSAELLTREEVRTLMDHARVKRDHPGGRGPRRRGGVEAARTAMGVLRHMYSWAIEEGKLKRKDNPASRITKNLPKKRQRETVLSLREAQIVWQAAAETAYPFGTHVQLMLLTGCRLSEWARAKVTWIDKTEALIVIPADRYKTNRVHVVPLVPQAMQLINGIPRRTTGDYLLSCDGGATPIRSVHSYYRTRLADAIIEVTGSRFAKSFSSHDLRRTVATRLAEVLGDAGDKLVKRVLGHSDGSVTAIYNRYAYVREMRAALERWARELTGTDAAGYVPSTMQLMHAARNDLTSSSPSAR